MPDNTEEFIADEQFIAPLETAYGNLMKVCDKAEAHSKRSGEDKAERKRLRKYASRLDKILKDLERVGMLFSHPEREGKKP